LDYTLTYFDAIGRLYQQIATDGTIVQAEYGYGLIPGTSTKPFGFTYTKVSNADDVTTWSILDPLGRTTEIRPAVTNQTTLETLGPWMFYEYDELGRLIKAHKVKKGQPETSTNKTTVTLTYDIGGRKTSLVDPDMGDWSYVYDAMGQVTFQTDARECTIGFTYDALGRPLTKSSNGTCGAGGNQVTYYYDDYADTPFFDDYTGLETNAKGRRTGMDDDSGFTFWTYDNRGRLIEEVKSISGYENFFVTSWEYNNGDQLRFMTYPNNEEVEFTYLPQGLPNTVDSPDGDYLVGSTYDASGRPIEQLFRSATSPMTMDYGYWAWGAPNNGLGRLKSVQATESGGSQGDLLDLYYGNSGTSTPGYDAVGNITRLETDTANNEDVQLYGYDDLDRLTSWQKCNPSCPSATTYSYDDYGRLVGLPDPGTYTYPGTGGLPFHAVDYTSTGDDFAYDANGNMTYREVDSVEFDLAYDRDNHLVDVDKENVPQFNFIYDGDGNRVKAVDEYTVYVNFLLCY
jgi:YD repeat-containing protein